MEILKKITSLIFILFLVVSCGEETITQTIKVRTDSYISSADNSNHSDLTYLNLSRSASVEERILLKVPTTKDDDDDLLDDCFDIEKTCGIFFMPISILVSILTTCSDAILQPANLTSAILILNTNDGSSIGAGNLSINLVAKPWWQSVSWLSAHPFSDKGLWSSPGGDLDTSVSFNNNCVGLSSGSCGAGEVKFEMTNYFQSLISNTNTTHYGVVIYPNTNISKSSLYSVQANDSLSPRIVATYTGSCKSGAFSAQKTFYLGQAGFK